MEGSPLGISISVRMACPEKANSSPPIDRSILEQGLVAWAKSGYPPGLADQEPELEFHGPELLLEFNHLPWKRVSSLGGLVDLFNSFHPPRANGWVIGGTNNRSPPGIPWNECPLWRTRLGSFASKSLRILVVVDPDMASSPIALWSASNGAQNAPTSLDVFCWYDNDCIDDVKANSQAIMFDLLMGRSTKELTPLSAPREGESMIGFSAPPRDLTDLTFPGKMKSAISKFASDGIGLLRIRRRATTLPP